MFQSTSGHVPSTPTGLSNFMSGSPISAAVSTNATSPITTSYDAMSAPPPYPMSTIAVNSLYPMTANYLNRTATATHPQQYAFQYPSFNTLFNNPGVTAPADNK